MDAIEVYSSLFPKKNCFLCLSSVSHCKVLWKFLKQLVINTSKEKAWADSQGEKNVKFPLAHMTIIMHFSV